MPNLSLWCFNVSLRRLQLIDLRQQRCRLRLQGRIFNLSRDNLFLQLPDLQLVDVDLEQGQDEMLISTIQNAYFEFVKISKLWNSSTPVWPDGKNIFQYLATHTN